MCGVGAHTGTPFRYCDNGMECYDPDANQWDYVPPMMHSRSNHCVQALGEPNTTSMSTFVQKFIGHAGYPPL